MSNKETHYNRPEGEGKGGRTRKPLSAERAKDKNKRSFKEGGRDEAPRSSRPVREKSDKPFREQPARRRPEGEERPERSFRKREEGDKPFRKPGSDRERPAFRRREGGEEPRRRREEGGHERPASRRDDRGEKPFRKREAGEKSSFRKGVPGERPFREPREGDDRPKRPRREDGAQPQRPAFRKEGGHNQPLKKYVPFEQREGGDEEAAPKRRFNKEEAGDRKPSFRDKKDGIRKRTDHDEASSKKPANPFEGEDFYEDEHPFTRSNKWDEKAKAGPMTLNKYLAHSGVSSRRDAAAIIKDGKVKVNGEVIVEPGYRVKEGDQVTFDGKAMTPQRNLVYILLNKPKGFITTTEDEKGRRTVMDLVANAGAERLYPVGRLDRATTGVLLITNDGDLAQKLSHPSYNSKKIYQVTLTEPLTKRDFEYIVGGKVVLEDGPAPVDALAYLEKKNEIGIEIHSGKNRIVRRIFESMGYEVEKLDRVVYAGLTKKNVSRGKWRFLTEKEIIRLKHFKG